MYIKNIERFVLEMFSYFRYNKEAPPPILKKNFPFEIPWNGEKIEGGKIEGGGCKNV